ncbi:unnamed protein product, partial [Ectocarpus sp. 6 AP-2014]
RILNSLSCVGEKKPACPERREQEETLFFFLTKHLEAWCCLAATAAMIYEGRRLHPEEVHEFNCLGRVAIGCCLSVFTIAEARADIHNFSIERSQGGVGCVATERSS